MFCQMMAVHIDRVYFRYLLRRQCGSIICKHVKSVNGLSSFLCFAKKRESKLIYVMRVQLCDQLAERLELGPVVKRLCSQMLVPCMVPLAPRCTFWGKSIRGVRDKYKRTDDKHALDTKHHASSARHTRLYTA